jgi:hypothetical protein
MEVRQGVVMNEHDRRSQNQAQAIQIVSAKVGCASHIDVSRDSKNMITNRRWHEKMP